MKKAYPNIFVSFLANIGVKYTWKFSNKFYAEHPHKDNLYGLSQMLTSYGIKNQGLRIQDKERAFADLEAPFIVFMRNDFAAVTKIEDDEVSYVWKNKTVSIPKEEFIRLWSGILLLPEVDEYSIEPDYTLHRRMEITSSVKIIFLLSAVFFLSGFAGYYSQTFHAEGHMIALLINSIGVYNSYLLLLKQMRIENSYADKICSLFLHQNDCNNLLESKASTFLGIFSWSEIGIGYFISNILMLLFFPSLYTYAVLINICALPYTLWSVCYQRFVARQWCPLCLLVQLCLWLLFMTHLVFHVVTLPNTSFISILLVGCIYLIPVLIANFLVPYWTDRHKVKEITYEINRIKADEDIFRIPLKSKKKYSIDRNASNILWGNPDARNMITVVTNPHCNPCSKMHKQLVDLLKETDNGFCIQYMLTSFNQELEESSKQFIALYMLYDTDTFLSILNEWYEKGRNNKEFFYKKYPFNRADELIDAELQRQKAWVKQSGIRATPTVLFNGYELPGKYKTIDMKNFVEMEIT
jgi:hypothetical protein